jgi:hypothetical protein
VLSAAPLAPGSCNIAQSGGWQTPHLWEQAKTQTPLKQTKGYGVNRTRAEGKNLIQLGYMAKEVFCWIMASIISHGQHESLVAMERNHHRPDSALAHLPRTSLSPRV